MFKKTAYQIRQEFISWFENTRSRWKTFGTMQMLALGIMLSGCADAPERYQPDAQMAASMSLGEAKAIIQRGYRWYSADGAADHAQVGAEFTPERMFLFINYYVDKTKHRVECRGLLMVSPLCQPPGTDKTKHRYECPPFDSIDPEVSGGLYIPDGVHKGSSAYHVDVGGCAVAVSSTEEAKSVAAALLRWKNSTLAERKAYLEGGQQRFAPIARQYRATHPIPAIPEEVRRFRIIAESAVQNNRFSDAADAYLDGLKVAPWWPSGQYNAALMLAQVHYYDEAIEHMQHYLALVPQASDARAAQDLIYQWQGEEASVQ